MRSARPKALHELAGRSMLAHTLSAVLEVADDVTVVVGPDREDVGAEALNAAPGAKIAVQRERRGTADRRGRLCRLGLGDRQASRCRRACGGARPPGGEGGLGEGFSGEAQEGVRKRRSRRAGAMT